MSIEGYGDFWSDMSKVLQTNVIASPGPAVTTQKSGILAAMFAPLVVNKPSPGAAVILPSTTGQANQITIPTGAKTIQFL